MSLESDIHTLAKDLIDKLSSEKLTLATSESCTGGHISKALTDISGASSVYDRGFITYSNEAKMDHLGVNGLTLEDHGAVSAETAKEMAIGTRKASRTNIAISTTGIAGPTGGSDTKPVGLVYIGLTDGIITKSERHIFKGDRNEIRLQATKQALKAALDIL